MRKNYKNMIKLCKNVQNCVQTGFAQLEKISTYNVTRVILVLHLFLQGPQRSFVEDFSKYGQIVSYIKTVFELYLLSFSFSPLLEKSKDANFN